MPVTVRLLPAVPTVMLPSWSQSGPAPAALVTSTVPTPVPPPPMTVGEIAVVVVLRRVPPAVLVWSVKLELLPAVVPTKNVLPPVLLSESWS